MFFAYSGSVFCKKNVLFAWRKSDILVFSAWRDCRGMDFA